MRNWTLVLLFVALVLLVACGGSEAVPPPPTQTNTGQATAVPVDQSAPTAEPTNPPLPPTIAPVDTSTPPPTPADPNAVNLFAPEDFGDDRDPLTGEIVSDPANLQRRPIAVKLSNAPAQFTRPQSGLNDADLVFEHTTEGAITRFTAIFYGETPPRVGPVRSARLIDLELPAMYDAALAFSGSSAGVAQRLQASDFAQRLVYGSEPGFYRTGENKPFEHTLYATPEQLWQTLETKGLNRPPTFTKINAFSSTPPEGGTPANKLSIDYQSTFVEWRWDPEIGRYRRWSDGEPHLDGNTLEQVTAANVIVLAPYHVFDPTICEQIAAEGTCASLSVQIQLWGSGSGSVFRDGQRYDVTWHREGRNDSLTFTDSAGNPFPLQIGNSWVQLVPTWLENPVTVTP